VSFLRHFKRGIRARVGRSVTVIRMSPKTVQALSLLLIAGAVVLGAFAISAGHWITLCTAVLIILAQALTIRKARNAREN